MINTTVQNKLVYSKFNLYITDFAAFMSEVATLIIKDKYQLLINYQW